MENTITVRPIKDTDAQWITEVMTAAWGSIMVAASRLFNSLELPGYIAEVNTKPVGIITYDILDGRLEIVTLNSWLHGCGVGTTLIEQVKKLTKERNLGSVWLTTSNDNIDALRFYQKRGFRITKVYPDAIDEARKTKPEIPEIGNYGIPLKDALELELKIE